VVHTCVSVTKQHCYLVPVTRQQCPEGGEVTISRASHRLKWFIQPHPQGLSKGDEHPTYLWVICTQCIQHVISASSFTRPVKVGGEQEGTCWLLRWHICLASFTSAVAVTYVYRWTLNSNVLNGQRILLYDILKISKLSNSSCWSYDKKDEAHGCSCGVHNLRYDIPSTFGLCLYVHLSTTGHHMW